MPHAPALQTKTSRLSALTLLGLAALLGCASTAAKQAALVPKPLTPDQAKAFDQGIDFVATLEGLDGKWRDDWDRDLQTRIGSADLVAAVTVTATRSDSDPSHRVTYRLVTHVDRELVGKADNKELELASTPEDTGYPSVEDNNARIADKQYVAYVRRGPKGSVWHLSPASPEVMAETESQITLLKRGPKQEGEETVIVHNN